MLELVSGFGNGSVHLLHSISELYTKATEDVTLPSVVLGVDARLNLLVVDNANAE